jgi:hypothetical protein
MIKNICTSSYLVCSQIWLNLPTDDDRHFFNIFLKMIAHFGYKPKKNAGFE